MAVDEDFILAMSQGTSWVAPKATALPDGMGTLSPTFTDLGAMDTAGLSETPTQTRTEFKLWGNIAVYKSVITDIKHTFKFTCLETNPAVLSLAYRTGVVPVPDATTHIISVTDDITGKLDPRAFVFDLIEGTNHVRFYCPNAEVTDVAAVTYALDKIAGYEFTVTAYPLDGVAIERRYLLDAVVAG